jgi:steroid 5-alpha reductase family enzyme
VPQQHGQIGDSNPPAANLAINTVALYASYSYARILRIMAGSSPKRKVLLACLLAYAVALAGAILVALRFNGNGIIFAAAAADLAATIIVFAFSMIFDNSSIYDPYWSVAPVAIAVYWANHAVALPALPVRQLAVMLLLLAWAFRLTFNCLRRWNNLKQEDWRYAEMRPGAGRLYWPLSFLGFHLFPTIVVFLGCLSLYVSLSAGNNQFGFLDLLAIGATGAAILIEAAADRQMDAFRAEAKNTGQNIGSGLWAYSRHPNYFGEVLFWWGLYLFALSADPGFWWVVIGPVAITLLFLFVSVPMMDRHMLHRRKSYADRMDKISALIPWFRRG